MTDQTGELLDRHGIPHDPMTVPLDGIDLDLSVAHQVRGQDVDLSHVARLTEGYERGDLFPPLIVRHVGVRLALVGGMHRTHAAQAAGQTHHAAYLVKVDDHTARLLAVEDNARHGLPLTRGEALHQAALLVDGGSTISDAARAVGIPPGTVHDEVQVLAGQARAERLGVTAAWAALRTRRKTQVVLARIDDDACFAAAAGVIGENTSVTFQTASQLVDRLAKIGDQQDRLAEIGDLDDQGGGYSGGPGTPAGPPRDDSEAVRLTNALIDLLDIDPHEAVNGLTKDGVERCDRRITDAGRRLIQLGRLLEQRQRGRAA